MKWRLGACSPEAIQFSFGNPDELVSKILMNEVYGLNEEELQPVFLKKIQSVNLAQVNQVAKQLHP